MDVMIVAAAASSRLDPDRLVQRSPLNQSFGSARSVPHLDEGDTHQSFLNPNPGSSKVNKLVNNRIMLDGSVCVGLEWFRLVPIGSD